MATYYIIPTGKYAAEIDAKDPEEALVQFATEMESDMGVYFKAVTKEELDEITHKQFQEAEEESIKDFMINELMSTLGYDENAAEEIADKAYDMYVSGKYDYTQYQCIEEAAAEYDRDKEKE